MEIDELMQLRRIYYNRVDVQYELLRSHVHRETAFLDTRPKTQEIGHPRRWLRCDTVQYLLKNMDYYEFLERPMNLYSSLATVKFPWIDFRKDFRAQQEEINEKYWEMMQAYDLGIDIDNDKKREGIFNTIDQARKVKAVFDQFKLCYTLKVSGSGFHFVIPYANLPESFRKVSMQSLLVAIRGFTFELCDKLGLTAIDTSIFDNKRIWKTAYSIDCKNWVVCYPLSDKEFDEFDGKLYKLENFNKPIYKRGLLQREGDPNGFQKMIDEG